MCAWQPGGALWGAFAAGCARRAFCQNYRYKVQLYADARGSCAYDSLHRDEASLPGRLFSVRVSACVLLSQGGSLL